MRVRVADATQVHYDGTTYAAGQELDVPEAVAAPWLAAGWVTPAVESKPAKASRTRRKAS